MYLFEELLGSAERESFLSGGEEFLRSRYD